jgi:hypothetical protein
MSESLRHLLRQGADAVERPELDVGRLVAQAERRMFRRRVTAVAASATAVAVVIAGGLALRPDEQRSSPAPPAPTVTPGPPTPSETPRAPDPGPILGEVRGWPDTSRNRAGVYSWDGATCAGPSCVMGFVHNGYGSGDVNLTIGRLSGAPDVKDWWTTTTIAGHEGWYRRTSARREEWIVEIEGTTIAVRLWTEPGTSRAELDEAHAMIDSMRTQSRRSQMGFRLVFTLTTDDWDSG